MSNLDGSNQGSLALRGARMLFMLPSLLALLLTGVYALGVWAGLNLTALNILCLFLYFAQAAPGCIGSVNRKKAASFLGALFISLVAVWLNFQAERLSLQGLRLRDLSGWSGAWAALLLAAAVSAAVVFARLLRWSQEQWEEVRTLRQERRLERRKFWFNFVSSWLAYFFSDSAHRLSMRNVLRATRKQAKEDRAAYKKEIRDIRYQRRIDIKQSKPRRKWNITPPPKDEEPVSDRDAAGTDQQVGLFWKIAIALVLLLILAGFILIPCSNGLMQSVSKWMDSVESLSVSFQVQSSPQGIVESGSKGSYSQSINRLTEPSNSTGSPNGRWHALFLYAAFYFLTLIIGALLVYLAYQLILSLLKHRIDGDSNLLDTYQTPIAILLVFSSFLATIGNFGFPVVSEWWGTLFITLLTILVLITSVEIVRLVLEQCSKPNTLLKDIIYLVFVSILKFLSEFLLSVITNFRIQMVVSSLLALVFPGSGSGFDSSVDARLGKLFHGATSHGHVEEEEGEEEVQEQPPVFREVRRRQIWRRNRK